MFFILEILPMLFNKESVYPKTPSITNSSQLVFLTNSSSSGIFESCKKTTTPFFVTNELSNPLIAFLFFFFTFLGCLVFKPKTSEIAFIDKEEYELKLVDERENDKKKK